MKIYISVLVVFFAIFSGNAQIEAEIQETNPTDELSDGEAQVIITKGNPPYKYYWSVPAVNIYTNKATGITEGTNYSVTVVDANNDSLLIEKKFPTSGFNESLNASVKPIVDFIAKGFFYDPFTALYEERIKIDKKAIMAPFWKDSVHRENTIKEWLVGEGDEVKDQQPIGIIQNGNEEYVIYAIGDGIVRNLVSPGTKVVEPKVGPNKKGSFKPRKLAEIEYPNFYFALQPNHTPMTRSIPLIVVWLVLGAVFFTIRMGFINVRGFKHSLDLVRGRYEDPNDEGEVSHFQALTTALSATVGLGNIASVAIAISIGGAGATFWMIIAGLLGMSSKFVECTLGVKYREVNEKGEVFGGPMYYLSKGLKKKNMAGLGKILAVIFAVLCIGGSLGGGNMFQANQAFAQMSDTFGMGGYGLYFGIILAILVGIVIIGGIKSIAKVTDKIVPVMVAVYVAVAIAIIFMNIENIGLAFSQIIDGAFNSDALKGGVLGVLIIGFQRAAFSNEAGVGSASIAHSAAKTKEPVSEGFVALLEPFIDTVLVCTMTSLVMIFTGFAADPDGLTGAELTTAAFSREIPWFRYVLTISILLFAFSSMISWSYYGLKSWTYLFGRSKTNEYIYKSIFLVFVVIGSTVGLGAVLDFSDMMILGMAFPNILGMLLLSGEVRRDLKDYKKRLKEGVIKRFK